MRLKKNEKYVVFGAEEWRVTVGKLYEVAGKVCGRALYDGGLVKGRKLAKASKLKSMAEIESVLKNENLAEQVQVERDIILVKGSFEGEALKPSLKPRCFYLAGVLAALYSACSGKDVKVEETDCIAMGKKECRFVVRELKWYEKMKEVMEVI